MMIVLSGDIFKLEKDTIYVCNYYKSERAILIRLSLALLSYVRIQEMLFHFILSI